MFYRIVFFMWCLLLANTTFAFSRQDSLRGQNGIGRKWWDVRHYALGVDLDTANQSIHGINIITAIIIDKPHDSLQLDLQQPLLFDSVFINDKKADWAREDNVVWVKYVNTNAIIGDSLKITTFYHGQPRKAKLPPWDGGFIWTKDSSQKPWIAVACQGQGASCWWPCKDIQSDEPDAGVDFTIAYPKGLTAVSNSEPMVVPAQFQNPAFISYDYILNRVNIKEKDLSSFSVSNPINNYDVTFYIGDYVSWSDTLMGEKGKLDIRYYALSYNETKARKQFQVVKPMLHCFESWMGPYPFYEDGYQLVEAPYLGMEHQSAVAYGNQYKMGYLGRDRSNSGVGLLFDFIIVHETGHEWFGNNVTATDVADNWIHEGFTTYTEALFAECLLDKKKAFEYTKGEWKNISNDRNVIGEYDVHDEGSGDKYDKGSAVVHMIRMLMNSDEQFRQLLRNINQTFYHKNISSAQLELFIGQHAQYDFGPLFDQYLRSNKIPTLEWYLKEGKLFFRLKDAVDGLILPVTISRKKKHISTLIKNEWQFVSWKHSFDLDFETDFLINLK